MERGQQPIVWVAQQALRKINGELIPAHDTSKADQFGEQRFVVDDRIKPWAPDQAVPAILEAIELYEPTTDHLLLIGSPIICSMLFSAGAFKIAAMGYSHLQLLYWHKREQNYNRILVPVSRLVGISK